MLAFDELDADGTSTPARLDQYRKLQRPARDGHLGVRQSHIGFRRSEPASPQPAESRPFVEARGDDLRRSDEWDRTHITKTGRVTSQAGEFQIVARHDQPDTFLPAY